MKYLNIYRFSGFHPVSDLNYHPAVLVASDVFSTPDEAAQDAWEHYPDEYETTLEWGDAPESARQRDFRADGTFSWLAGNAEEQYAHDRATEQSVGR